MALKRAEILTPWATMIHPVHGTINVPQVTVDFALSAYQDITGQPAGNLIPDPNLFSILAQADETVIAAIGADNRYYVLWEEYV